MTSRRLALILCTAFLTSSGSWGAWQDTAPVLAQERQDWSDEEIYQGDVADVQVFYEPLAPYGRWTTVAEYGQVWIPHDVPSGWRPYMEGRWVYTRHGWTWIAEQPWGWAPFHYGRWAFVTYYGWVWIPGTVWGPAWVVWRYTPGWVGWAPLPPRVVFQPGIGLQGGGAEWNLEPAWFCFVEERRLIAPRVVSYIASPSRNVVLLPRTHNVTRYTVYQNRIVNTSVPVERIERATAQPVPRMRIVRPYAPEGQPGMRLREKEREVLFYRPDTRAPQARPPISSRQPSSPLPVTSPPLGTQGTPSVPPPSPQTLPPGRMRPPGGPVTPAETPSYVPPQRPGGVSREERRRRYEAEPQTLEERHRQDRRRDEPAPRPSLPGNTPQRQPQDGGLRPPEPRPRPPREPQPTPAQLQQRPGVERQPLTRAPYERPPVPAQSQGVTPHTSPRPQAPNRQPGADGTYPRRQLPPSQQPQPAVPQ